MTDHKPCTMIEDAFKKALQPTPRRGADQPCDPADPCATAYDLSSERNTLDGLWAETKDRLDAALAQVARLREALAAIVARSENGELGTSRTRDMAGLARAALAETAAEFAPGHTDMMVPPETLDAFMAANPLPPEPADDGWTAWEGGECPVAEGTLVDIRFRNGDCRSCELGTALRWNHAGWPLDIVAYRIVEARDE